MVFLLGLSQQLCASPEKETQKLKLHCKGVTVLFSSSLFLSLSLFVSSIQGRSLTDEALQFNEKQHIQMDVHLESH